MCITLADFHYLYFLNDCDCHLPNIVGQSRLSPVSIPPAPYYHILHDVIGSSQTTRLSCAHIFMIV